MILDTGVLATTELPTVATVRKDKSDSDSDVSIHSIPSSPKETAQIEKISYIEVKSQSRSRSRSR